MPFKKVNNKYKSPSGKTFSKKQVKLYYARVFDKENTTTKGFQSKAKKAKSRGK